MRRNGQASTVLPLDVGGGSDGSLVASPVGVAFVVVSIAVLGAVLAGVSFRALDFPVSAAVVILILGVPHGGFDVALARNRWDLGTPTRVAVFLAVYVGFAGAVLAIWTLLPGFALPCFLLVSGFHFAGDWEGRLGRLPRMLVGTAIITAPVVLHRPEVTEIFSWIVPAVVARAVPDLMRGLAFPSILGTVIVLMALERAHVMVALEVSAVLALALFTEPLCFFLIYFCGLHSIRHMEIVHRELRPRSIAAFVSLSLPYAPLAIAGTLLGGWWLMSLGDHSTMLGVVFLSLAALTAPHMLLVDSRKPRTRVGGTS